MRVYVVDLEDGWSQAATPRARSWDQVTCMSMPCSASEGGERCPLNPPPASLGVNKKKSDSSKSYRPHRAIPQLARQGITVLS